MFIPINFSSVESKKILEDFVHGQLMPAIQDLNTLSVNVARYRMTFLHSFKRRKVNHIEKQYQEQNKNFLVLYFLYNNPNKLFASLKLDPKNDEALLKDIMDDYRMSGDIVLTNFKQGFRMLEIIDRQLNRYYQSADQRIAIIFSMTAITVSLLTLIAQIRINLLL
jgi:hypothetical protein